VTDKKKCWTNAIFIRHQDSHFSSLFSLSPQQKQEQITS